MVAPLESRREPRGVRATAADSGWHWLYRMGAAAAGEALLAINNPGAVDQGTGIYLSLFLVTLAGLLISPGLFRGLAHRPPSLAAQLSRSTSPANLIHSVCQPGVPKGEKHVNL